MDTKHIKISDYNYDLPDERIAKFPIAQRDHSKLLVYKHGEVSDDVFYHLPEYLPKEVSEWLSDITIEDLLTMRSGFVFFNEVRTEHLDWVKTYLNHPMNCKPGTRFQYDSLDTYLLSAIIQKVTVDIGLGKRHQGVEECYDLLAFYSCLLWGNTRKIAGLGFCREKPKGE